MTQKTATDWWNRHIESTFYEEDVTSENPRSIKLLLCAMFERAWHDLDITAKVLPEDRRSAIAWFKGINEDKIVVTFRWFIEVIGMTPDRRVKLDKRIQLAETFIAEKRKHSDLKVV